MCPHGVRCYRKNPAHFADEDHPSEHPLIAAEVARATCMPQPPVLAPATDDFTPAKRGHDEAFGTAATGDDDDDDAGLMAFDLDGAIAKHSLIATRLSSTPPPNTCGSVFTSGSRQENMVELAAGDSFDKRFLSRPSSASLLFHPGSYFMRLDIAVDLAFCRNAQ